MTSRAALRLSGEHEYAVPPLTLPPPGTHPTVETLAFSEAVALFVARSQAVRPDFALTDANAGAIAGICRAVDGLPLALELAAARAKLLDPATMLARLSTAWIC